MLAACVDNGDNGVKMCDCFMFVFRPVVTFAAYALPVAQSAYSSPVQSGYPNVQNFQQYSLSDSAPLVHQYAPVPSVATVQYTVPHQVAEGQHRPMPQYAAAQYVAVTQTATAHSAHYTAQPYAAPVAQSYCTTAMQTPGTTWVGWYYYNNFFINSCHMCHI
jgi:hypothetical protein